MTFPRITQIVPVIAIAIIASAACAPVPTPVPPPPPPTAVPATVAPTAVPPTAVAPSTIPPTAVPATATSAPAAASSGASVSIVLNLSAGRDGDQTPGTVTLTSQGTKTQVDVSLKPAAAGVAQPNHIHEGACPGVGAVKYPLSNIVDGKGTTVIDAQLKDLLTGGFAYNAHESTANAGKYVACAGIPKGAVLSIGPGRDGDQTPASVVLISAGTKTDVYVSIKPAAAGIAQPNHFHEGACPGVGAVKFPLTNIVDGKGKTTIDASLDDLLKGGYSYNAHESTANAGKYVACGAVK